METYGEVERLGHRPERLVHRIVHHLLAVIRIGSQEAAAHPELFAREAHLVDRELDRLHRQHRDAEETVGIPVVDPSWKPMEKSSASAIAQNGSYIGSFIIFLP